MPKRRYSVALGALAGVALGLVGCGGDEPLLQMTPVTSPSQGLVVSGGLPSFPGASSVCGFVMEPDVAAYQVGTQIVVTATQATGAAGYPIARYDWDFGDGLGNVSGRQVSYAYKAQGAYVVRLLSTESVTGAVYSCTRPAVVH